jgi:Protein of unknown function (DUF2378)
MPDPKRELVSRNLLDGLFLGIAMQERRAAAALCGGCGYDTAHPHAFYDAAVALCITRRLGQLLCSGAALAVQQYELGRVAVSGYALTLPGRVIVARRPHEALAMVRYYMPLLHRELPQASATVTAAEEQGCTVEVSGFPLHPAFIQGELAELLRVAGMAESDCRYAMVGEAQFLYTLRWQQPRRWEDLPTSARVA